MTNRKVSADGLIKLKDRQYFIGSSLAVWSVGLKPVVDTMTEVWFGRLLLGWIESATESFQRPDFRPLEAGQP